MKNSFAAAAMVMGIGVSGCAAMNQPSSPGVIVSEDFESTPAGAIPAGFTKTGDVAVEEGVAHSGKHALRIEPAVRGGRFISLDPAKVAALGGEHWGRLYFKVKTPTPLPTGRLIHATLVDGKGTSPLANDLIDVRLATLLFYPTGDYGWFYNVQPPNGRKEFGPKSATMQEVADIGQHKGAGNYEGIEIPAAFQTLSVGFTNYQPATGEGFTVWIDDFAVGKERLGPVRGAAR